MKLQLTKFVPNAINPDGTLAFGSKPTATRYFRFEARDEEAGAYVCLNANVVTAFVPHPTSLKNTWIEVTDEDYKRAKEIGGTPMGEATLPYLVFTQFEPTTPKERFRILKIGDFNYTAEGLPREVCSFTTDTNEQVFIKVPGSGVDDQMCYDLRGTTIQVLHHEYIGSVFTALVWQLATAKPSV